MNITIIDSIDNFHSARITALRSVETLHLSTSIIDSMPHEKSKEDDEVYQIEYLIENNDRPYKARERFYDLSEAKRRIVEITMLCTKDRDIVIYN